MIAASVGTASVVGLTVAAVVAVCRARKGGRRSIDHYDFSEDTQVLCTIFPDDDVTVPERNRHLLPIRYTKDVMKCGNINASLIRESDTETVRHLGIFHSFPPIESLLFNQLCSLFDSKSV